MTACTRWLVAVAALTAPQTRGQRTEDRGQRRVIFTVLCLLSSVLSSVAWAAPVPNAGDPSLAVVPGQSPIVIHLRGVERTKERLTAMLTAAIPDLGPVAAAQIDNLVQSGVEGRKLQGLAKDGPVFLAFLEMPTPGAETPSIALIARVTRYSEFRDGLLNDDERKGVKKDNAGYERAEINGREFFFVDRKDYAVVTPSKDVAVLMAKKYPGLDDKLSQPVGRRLLDSDLGLYVNLAAVNKEYGEQIKSARQMFEGLLETAAVGDKSSVEMAKKVYGGMFQLIEDGRALLVALDFRPQGLNLHLQAQVGADTPSGKLLQGQQPTALDRMGDLPNGLMTYTGSHVGPEMLKLLGPMMFGTSGGQGENRKQGEAALEELIAAGPTGAFSAANLPPAGINVQTCKDPAKAAAAQLKLMRSLSEGGTFQNAYLKGKPEIKENAQDYKGYKLHSARMTWDLDKFAEMIPGGGEAAKGAIKKLMGEGLTIWFGTDGKQMVSLSAQDWDAAKKLLDAYASGQDKVGQTQAFQATRRQLPADATMLFMADAGKLTYVMGDYMLSLFKAMPGLPFNLPEGMKPVKTDTSYLGGAVTLRPEHGSFDFFLPVTGVQAMRKVIQPLFLGGATE